MDGEAAGIDAPTHRIVNQREREEGEQGCYNQQSDTDLCQRIVHLFYQVVLISNLGNTRICLQFLGNPLQRIIVRVICLRRNLYGRLVAGTVPAVVLGLAFNDFIESNLGNVQLVGWMLVIGGIFMLFCDKIFNKGSEQTKLTYKRALIIGFIQCIAMIPGVSRSMSTIVGGMSQRLTRKAAAEFSFFLAVPTMFGATCLEVYKLISHGGGSLLTQGNNLFTLILGSVVAFIVAILAIGINHILAFRIFLVHLDGF